MNVHGSRACHCLTRARAFAAKLKEAHALLEAERIEAFSTADQEPPADRATFQNPLGTDARGVSAVKQDYCYGCRLREHCWKIIILGKWLLAISGYASA